MPPKKRDYLIRYVVLAALFVLMSLIYIARLINVQIAGQDYYTAVASYTDTVTRTVKIQAHRGEIFDRNGTPLVVNKKIYNIVLDYGAVGGRNTRANSCILGIIECAGRTGQTANLKQPFSPFSGRFPDYAYDAALLSDSAAKAKFTRALKNLQYDEDISCEDLTSKLLFYFGITDKKGNLLYTEDEADTLLAYRFDMVASGFASNNQYVILNDASIETLTQVGEASLRGSDVNVTIERVICFPGVASNIIGRTGKIQSDKTEYYTEQGYAMDAIVGLDGAEAAFETYLRGVDGEMKITEDLYGNVISREVTVEPIAGNNIWLTIDINLQAIAEKALGDNIAYIAEKGAQDDEELSGEDAAAGALTVIKPSTGEVLVLASYPTYDLTTFSENYATLANDPNAPLYDRSLLGQYPPGSTFKLATAAAALSEGIITPDTVINDTGRYTFYSDPQPRCWIYIKYGIGHGKIDLTEAIQVSCNYYFFEVGRLLGISALNKYCRALGLGQATGIELPEKLGILAGPEYREGGGGEAWSPGDTIAAAIGQSDNVFTPLQMSVYMGALVNRGVRMKAHILKCVREYGTDAILYEPEPQVVDSVRLSENNYRVLMNAMKSVTENGSAARVFSSYPLVVGGKTGTAQVAVNKSANAVFTAFAPFDSPEIVATCVIEQGANGTDAGFAVRDVFSKYFGIGEDGGDAADSQ
jgi:penicillin-binding protein 2